MMTLLFVYEDGEGPDFDEQIAAADSGLDGGAGGEGVQAQCAEELIPNLVELGVIPFDVPDVTGGTDNIVPVGAFILEEPGDIAVGAPELGPEITRIQGFAGFSDAGSAADKQLGDASGEINAQAAGEGAAVFGCLVQDFRGHDRFLVHRWTITWLGSQDI